MFQSPGCYREYQRIVTEKERVGRLGRWLGLEHLRYYRGRFEAVALIYAGYTLVLAATVFREAREERPDFPLWMTFVTCLFMVAVWSFASWIVWMILLELTRSHTGLCNRVRWYAASEFERDPLEGWAREERPEGLWRRWWLRTVRPSVFTRRPSLRAAGYWLAIVLSGWLLWSGIVMSISSDGPPLSALVVGSIALVAAYVSIPAVPVRDRDYVLEHDLSSLLSIAETRSAMLRLALAICPRSIVKALVKRDDGFGGTRSGVLREPEFLRAEREMGYLNHISLREVAQMVVTRHVGPEWPVDMLRKRIRFPVIHLSGWRGDGGGILKWLHEELDSGSLANIEYEEGQLPQVLAKLWLFQRANDGDPEAAAILVGRVHVPPVNLLPALLRHPTEGAAYAIRAARYFASGMGDFPLDSVAAYACALRAQALGATEADAIVTALAPRVTSDALKIESTLPNCDKDEWMDHVAYYLEGHFERSILGETTLVPSFGLLDPRYRSRGGQRPAGWGGAHDGFADRIAWLPGDQIDIDWPRLIAHADDSPPSNESASPIEER